MLTKLTTMPGERAETLVVELDSDGQRLDKWLTGQLTDLDYDVSRSQVQNWIDEGRVTGTKAKTKSNDVVSKGATYVIRIPEPETVTIVPESIRLEIVHEDPHVVVVNKPRGLVVHPAAGHETGTVINGLAGLGIPLSSLGGLMRPGVVHRIDKDTSGLVVFAKTDLAYHRLSEQLRNHTMDRVYLAIAHGVMSHPQATVDAPIGRDPRNRQRMAVVAAGKPSVTHLRILETFEHYSYVELRLETGRTHQIRVHLAYIGHPLAGDPLYGKTKALPIEGQALHAATLGFAHPESGEHISFRADLPEDMKALLEDLRANRSGMGT